MTNNTTFTHVSMHRIELESPEHIFTEAVYKQGNRKQLELLESQYRYAYKFASTAQKLNDLFVFRNKFKALVSIISTVNEVLEAC